MLDEAGAWDRLHAELDDLDPADVGRAGAKSQACPGDRLRRRASRRPGRRDSDCLPQASTGVRRGGQPRRPELGDRRGSPNGELRRPAGFVPQHQGRRESARHVPPLFRKSFHRSRHPLPNRPGLRPLQGLAVDRRDEDGALRHLVVGCDVLARHRVGLSRRRLRDWRLRSGRERGSGRRRPRRVLRPQADLSSRPSRGVAPAPRRQGREDDPRRGRNEEHDAKHPDPEGRPRVASASPTRTCWNWPATRARSSSTTAGRWTWSGPRTGSTESSTSSRPAPRRLPRSTA